jgi:16S rRNA (guanine527-N7)-methyltransferase
MTLTQPGDEPRPGTTGPGATEPPGPLPAPEPPEVAQAVFGDTLELAWRFARELADTGVSHGLLGPREVPILWERHLLNCAVYHPAFPPDAQVVDVGSGAGLPGLVLAIVRPDLRLQLVEPMLRRTTWLDATVKTLGLVNVEVHRGRAEELQGEVQAPYATARAVARIDKLARWTFPLLADHGCLVALKGARAAEELAAEEKALRRLGMTSAQVRTYGAELLAAPSTTLELTVGPRHRRRGNRPAAGPAQRRRRRAG